MAWELGIEAAINLGQIPERPEGLRVDYWRYRGSEPNTRETMWSQHGLRDPFVSVCGQLLRGWCYVCMWTCVCACLWSEGSVPAVRVGFAHHMLASRETCDPALRYWIDWVCKTSYWRDLCCIHMYIFPINRPSSSFFCVLTKMVRDHWCCLSLRHWWAFLSIVFYVACWLYTRICSVYV